MEKKYLVLAYYLFAEIQNPQQEINSHKKFFEGKDIRGRIYISEEGINGQMSGSVEDASLYMDWIKDHPIFKKIWFKIHHYHENVFPKVIVKYRKQLVALDRKVDLSKTASHLSPKEWKEKLEKKDPNLLVLDVRNHYEWKVGHFEGSVAPDVATFREFVDYAEELAEKRNKKDPIMMCCTGGIRCELYSSFLKEKGFENVSQLEGGIINYGQKEGSAYWKGKLFVFDDRMVTAISEEDEAETIAKCHFCNSLSDHYYNCANMDCNELFICCPACLKDCQGCCQKECMEAPRVRPYHHQNPHKPFRKWYQYFSKKAII